MKKLYFSLILLCWFLAAHAQVTINAYVQDKFSGYKEGDSVRIYGFVKNPEGQGDFLIKKNDDYKRIPVSKVKASNATLGFWDHLWFYNRAGEVYINGWDDNIRNDMQSDCRDFVQNLQKNQLLFDDAYVLDYLSQLVHKICPTKLNKPRDNYLNVYVMKSNDVQSFSFDNGTIVISTALLAGMKSESELAEALAKEVTNIVLEHNLVNLKHQIRAQRAANFWTGLAAVASTAAAVNSAAKGNDKFTFDDALAVTAATAIISNSIVEGIGAKYTNEQNTAAFNDGHLFVTTEYNKMEHKTPDEFNRIISEVLSYTAWQNFYALNYTESMKLINRLENAGIATEDDYLLKAKIYRTLYNTDESNYEALRCIKTAKGIGIVKLVDLSKEEGLLYLRIGDKVKAKTAFQEYLAGLEELQSKGDDCATEIKWVRNILYKNI
ncbi:MAG TPA: M48 family metalloprotease [Bacteroidales bacterium]